jgi:hypothetical protein
MPRPQRKRKSIRVAASTDREGDHSSCGAIIRSVLLWRGFSAQALKQLVRLDPPIDRQELDALISTIRTAAIRGRGGSTP